MHTHMYPQPWRGLVINMQSQFGGNREERVSYYMYPRRRPLLISNHTITYAWCKLWREREKTHMDPAWNSFALIKAYICPWLYTYIVFLMVFVFIPRDWHGTTASDDHWNGRSLISSSKNRKLTIISSRVTCSKVSWGYSPSNPSFPILNLPVVKFNLEKLRNLWEGKLRKFHGFVAVRKSFLCKFGHVASFGGTSQQSAKFSSENLILHNVSC